MKQIVLYILFFIFSLVSAQEVPFVFTLNEAVEYAQKHSYSAKNAATDIQSAAKKVWETTVSGLPQINATVDFQKFLKQPVNISDFNGDGIDEEAVFGKKQSVDASVTLTQLIFDGTYFVGLKSAKTFKKITENAAKKTALTIKESVVSAYTTVLMAEENIVILENNKKVVEENLKEVEALVKNGFSEIQDAEQLQLSLSSINNQLNKAKRYNFLAYKLLKLSMGIAIDAPIELTDSFDSLIDKAVDLSLLNLDFDSKKHINYQIAFNDLQSKDLLVKYHKNKALPSLRGFINYGATAYNNKFDFFNSEQKWYNYAIFGVSLKVPLFSSFGLQSIVNQAKFDLEKSERNLEEVNQQLQLNAYSSLNDYQYSIDNYQTSKKNVKLAKSIEHKESIKFKEGVSTSFELTTIRNQMYGKQQEYIEAIYSLINNKILLENALGAY